MNAQALRDRIGELEEENRQLREALRPTVAFSSSLGLTGKESAILAAIIAGYPKKVSRDRVWLAGWGHDCGERDTLSVKLCLLRKKLAPHGVTIQSQYGQGLWIDAESAAIVRGLMQDNP